MNTDTTVYVVISVFIAIGPGWRMNWVWISLAGKVGFSDRKSGLNEFLYQEIDHASKSVFKHNFLYAWGGCTWIALVRTGPCSDCPRKKLGLVLELLQQGKRLILGCLDFSCKIIWLCSDCRSMEEARAWIALVEIKCSLFWNRENFTGMWEDVDAVSSLGSKKAYPVQIGLI